MIWDSSEAEKVHEQLLIMQSITVCIFLAWNSFAIGGIASGKMTNKREIKYVK